MVFLYYRRTQSEVNTLTKHRAAPKIGEVYMMKFGGTNNEQNGWRPGLVFQNNIGNSFSPNIIALPLTGSIKKPNQPTHVFIKASDVGLLKDSMVLCENLERMSKDRIGKYITTLPKEIMGRVAVGNLLASSAISFIEPEKLVSLWHQASALNAAAAS